MSRMAPPRRSNESRPISPAPPPPPQRPMRHEESRTRSSSANTPGASTSTSTSKTLPSLPALDPFTAPPPPPQSRRPNKASLSSSGSAAAGLIPSDSTSTYAGLGGAQAGTPTPTASGSTAGLLNVRSASRNEMYPARDTAASPAPSISSMLPRISPQKTQRTLDNKFISERLGIGMPHYGSSSSTSLAQAASISTLSLPSGSAGMVESRSAPMLSSSVSGNASSSLLSFPSLSLLSSPHDTPLGALHIHVLPLFNGEPLRAPIEELNRLVREHLQLVISKSPSRAMATLAADVTELVATGMLNLDAKLTNIDDDKFLTRLVEVWTFFWVQVLPYVEGVFLPLQTNPILLSLGKAHKSSTRHDERDRLGPGAGFATLEPTRLDVRRLVLIAFRDAIILPRVEKLKDLLGVMAASKGDGVSIGVEKSDGYQRPRIQQMLLVLQSTSGPLTTPTGPAGATEPSPGEYATQQLLRVIHRPRPQHHQLQSSSSSFTKQYSHSYSHPLGSSPSTARAHNKTHLGPMIAPASTAAARHPLKGGMNALVHGVPRDRRGRIVKLDSPSARAWKQNPNIRDSGPGSGGEAGRAGREGAVEDDGDGTPVARRRRATAEEEYGEGEEEDEGEEDSEALELPQRRFGPLPPGDGRAYRTTHERDDDDGDDDDSDLGQPLGSTTPTLTSAHNSNSRIRSRQELQMMSSGGTVGPDASGWRRRRGAEEEEYEDEEEEEDYGRPVPRTITASPPMMPSALNRV